MFFLELHSSVFELPHYCVPVAPLVMQARTFQFLRCWCWQYWQFLHVFFTIGSISAALPSVSSFPKTATGNQA